MTLAEQKRGTAAFPKGFDLTIREHKLKEPFKLKVPTLIFTNSMSDLFWDQVPNEYRHKIVDVIEATPQHEYQVLTKRPENLLKFSKERKLPANFWAGVTVEANLNRNRIRTLQEVEAEIKFISAEPLIRELDLTDHTDGISWVITGGESGNHLWDQTICDNRALVYYDRSEKKWKPRPERMDWIRNIRDVSIDKGVKFFHKQWGGNYPEAAGRTLDGKTWSEMPRYPGQKQEIDNAYLRHLESGGVIPKGKKEQLLMFSV